MGLVFIFFNPFFHHLFLFFIIPNIIIHFQNGRLFIEKNKRKHLSETFLQPGQKQTRHM